MYLCTTRIYGTSTGLVAVRDDAIHWEMHLDRVHQPIHGEGDLFISPDPWAGLGPGAELTPEEWIVGIALASAIQDVYSSPKPSPSRAHHHRPSPPRAAGWAGD